VVYDTEIFGAILVAAKYCILHNNSTKKKVSNFNLKTSKNL